MEQQRIAAASYTDEPETRGRQCEKAYKVQSVSLSRFMLSSGTQARPELWVRGRWGYKGPPARNTGQKWLPGVLGHCQGPIAARRKRKGAVPHRGVQVSWDGEQHRFPYLLSRRCVGVGLGEAPPFSQVNLPWTHTTVQTQQHHLFP